TIAGLYDDAGEYLNSGLVVELEQRLLAASPFTQKRQMGKVWVLNVDPKVYQAAVQGWLSEFHNIRVLTQASITKPIVATSDHSTVKQVSISRGDDELRLETHSVIDATGGAELVRRLDPSLVSSGSALAGWVVQLRGVTPGVFKFPFNVSVLNRIRKATKEGLLPEICSTLWLDSGVQADELYGKFNLSEGQADTVDIADVSTQLSAFLRNIPELADVTVATVGTLGIRDKGQICGDYCLTESDVKNATPFNDSACQAAWPIEHWHSEKGIQLEYLPKGHRYSIPLRTLAVKGFRNLWVCGKSLSAEPRAQASARVVGTCWALGDALGKHLSKEALQ
ncbi:MAG: FAD-dependent oxidoreductase, partial [Leucothrix sp.]